MANIFVRISDVINANINDMIDKVEDPERMIKQIIREMEENIRDAKESVINAIASEKQLKRELDHHRNEIDKWQAKAEKALRADREDLAREALGRKSEHERITGDLDGSWTKARETGDRLKEQLRAMENKLAEVRRKQGTLVARKRSADARKALDNTHSKINRGLEIETRFGRMEKRVFDAEAEAEAIAEINDDSGGLDREIEDLEKEDHIESDLEKLKKKIGQGES